MNNFSIHIYILSQPYSENRSIWVYQRERVQLQCTHEWRFHQCSWQGLKNKAIWWLPTPQKLGKQAIFQLKGGEVQLFLHSSFQVVGRGRVVEMADKPCDNLPATRQPASGKVQVWWCNLSWVSFPKFIQGPHILNEEHWDPEWQPIMPWVFETSTQSGTMIQEA